MFCGFASVFILDLISRHVQAVQTLCQVGEFLTYFAHKLYRGEADPNLLWANLETLNHNTAKVFGALQSGDFSQVGLRLRLCRCFDYVF